MHRYRRRAGLAYTGDRRNMGRPLFALALDAVPPALLEAWIAEGVTPRIAALRAAGAYGRLTKAHDHPHEASWSAFLQGCAPRAGGEWGRHVYFPERYRVEDRPSYRLDVHPPFYALPGIARALIFDVPHAPLVNALEGVQMLGWGMEENLFKRASVPPALFDEVTRRHGAHPFFGGAAARVIAEEGDGTVAAFRLPSVYDPQALRALEGQIQEAIRRRAAILAELAAREPWTLALAASAELHLAMHMLWHEPRALSAAARAFDDSLGGFLERVPREATLVLFSVSGMTANYTDLPVSLFLPELLYRLEFGEAALAPGEAGAPVPPPAAHYRAHWKDEIWALRTPRGERELESPAAQERRKDPFDWCPLNWYAPLWPRMRAFALPSFSHGMVRVNLKGRDAQGVVAPAEYASTCDALAAAIRALVNARTGRPIAKEVTRTRASPTGDGAHLPPADLMVTWDADEPADVVESPRAGRIGPVPWLRTGGHMPDGFCLLAGPGIAPGTRLPENAAITDLTATLLKMLGVAIPPYAEGRPLV